MNSKKCKKSFASVDPAHKVVRRQLQRILSSPSFRGSPQLSRLLSFLVESVLSDQVHRIKQYTIAVDVFGYSEDFDPNTNTAVRVFAIRLRHALALYYVREGEHDDIRIEIPKRTYVPVIRSNGKPTSVGSAGAPMAQFPAITHHGQSVTVIPFKLQPCRRKNNLAESIAESIVIGLAGFRDLTVAGPLIGYTDAGKKKSERVRQYQSRFVLDGHLQMNDDVLRFKMALTDRHTGSKIWAQTYEYLQTAANRFQIEDDITRHVVAAVADYNGVIPRLISLESLNKPADALDSCDAVALYKHFLSSFKVEGLQAALGALKRAAGMDPDNPVVSAMLSNAICHDFLCGADQRPAMLEEAVRLVRLSLDIDPDYPLAHFTEGFLLFLQGQNDRCVAKLEKTISLKTYNTYVVHSCAFLYCMLGHWDKGMDLWKEARHLNPRYPVISLVPFIYHYFHGNYDEAWDYAVKLDNGLFWAPLARAITAGQMGRQAEAKSALRELLKLHPAVFFHSSNSWLRLFHSLKLVERFFDGLQKAGFEFSDMLQSASM